MLQGEHPHDALELFHNLGLFDSVFAPPQIEKGLNIPRERLYESANAFKYLLLPETQSHYPKIASLVRSEKDVFMGWVLAALTPWESHTILEKKKQVQTAYVAARDGLKMKARDYDLIALCFGNAHDLRSAVLENDASGLSRFSLGS